MAIDNPELQTEQGRELILTGDLEQVKDLLDVEVSLSEDLTVVLHLSTTPVLQRACFRESRHALGAPR
jgi:hypothetical protein